MTIPVQHRRFIIRQASVRIERLELRMLEVQKRVDEFREEDKIRKE